MPTSSTKVESSSEGSTLNMALHAVAQQPRALWTACQACGAVRGAGVGQGSLPPCCCAACIQWRIMHCRWRAGGDWLGAVYMHACMHAY